MNKKESIILQKTHYGYRPISSADLLISSLAWMFNESITYVQKICQIAATNEKDTGLTGNATIMRLRSDIVEIEPLYAEDSENWLIRIPKKTFVKLVTDWQELIAQHPDEIVMTRDEQGKITLEGIFNHQETFSMVSK